MPQVIELTSAGARAHLLKGSSYFNGDFPKYISFEPILQGVAAALSGGDYNDFKSAKPHTIPNVNYSFTANKDGRFAKIAEKTKVPFVQIDYALGLVDIMKNAFGS